MRGPREARTTPPHGACSVLDPHPRDGTIPVKPSLPFKRGWPGERRVVRLGIRDGDYVQVESGVESGERIVTRGAYLVRLAAASPAEAGHGHAH